MQNKKYHTVWTVPISNEIIVGTQTKSIYIHVCKNHKWLIYICKNHKWLIYICKNHKWLIYICKNHKWFKTFSPLQSDLDSEALVVFICIRLNVHFIRMPYSKFNKMCPVDSWEYYFLHNGLYQMFVMYPVTFICANLNLNITLKIHGIYNS